MTKKHTTFKFILSVFTAILIILALIFFLRIIKNKNKNTSATLMSLQEKMETKEKMTMFSEKSSEIKVLQNLINSYFVDTKKIDTFVSYLENLGVDVGAEVIVKEIVVPEKTNNIIEFQVSINGTFDQITKTIVLLENIPYQIEVTRVYYNKEINNKEESNTKNLSVPTWQADVAFNILSLN